MLLLTAGARECIRFLPPLVVTAEQVGLLVCAVWSMWVCAYGWVGGCECVWSVVWVGVCVWSELSLRGWHRHSLCLFLKPSAHLSLPPPPSLSPLQWDGMFYIFILLLALFSRCQDRLQEFPGAGQAGRSFGA